MSKRKIFIKEVCKLNAETIGSKNTPVIIHYLDTSSITRNKIEKIQLLDQRVEAFPSRAQRKVKNETIIYSTVRPEQEHFGILENPVENFIVSTGFITLDVIDNELNPKFLYYALSQKKVTDYLNTIAANNVTSYPSINPSDLGNLELEIPKTKETQQKIANVLSTLDAKIALNNRINAELEAMAKTLYDYWFVQFEFPHRGLGGCYKTSGGTMVWNEDLKREIPEGWEVDKLEKVVSIVRGASPRPIDDYLSSTGVNWIKISDATESNNRFIIATKQFIIQDGVAKSRFLKPNTLILSNSASPAIPRIVKIESCVHDGWLIIDKYKDGLTIEYLYHYFDNERPNILNLGNGSIFKNLKTEYLKEYKMVIPPKSILDQFTPIFKDLSDKVYINTIENQKLSSLRDWLLPMLMNGQVVVA